MSCWIVFVINMYIQYCMCFSFYLIEISIACAWNQSLEAKEEMTKWNETLPVPSSASCMKKRTLFIRVPYCWEGGLFEWFLIQHVQSFMFEFIIVYLHLVLWALFIYRDSSIFGLWESPLTNSFSCPSLKEQIYPWQSQRGHVCWLTSTLTVLLDHVGCLQNCCRREHTATRITTWETRGVKWGKHVTSVSLLVCSGRTPSNLVPVMPGDFPPEDQPTTINK